MSDTILDLSNVINISIVSAPTDLGVPNVNTAALFSRETPSNYGSAAFKIYTNLTDVATDWGTGSNAYKIAASFFAQQPNPLNTGGYLTIIPLLSMETVEAALIRTANLVYYVGVLVDELLDEATLLSLAIAVQALDKLLFYASSNQADYAPGGVLDQIRVASETHTRCLYYSDGTAIDTQKYAAAYAARALSTDFTGSATTQTMHLKTLAGVTPDNTVDQTQLAAAQLAGVDVYVNIAGLPACFTSGANAFFDEIYNELWFKFALQVAGFNYLRGTTTKIPQTEPGMDGLKNEYRKICVQAAQNGFLAPGSWTSPDVFGNPASLIRSVADVGYYVYSLPIAQQAQADRADRIAPLVQIAVKAAGAIHKSNVIVNVNI